MSPNRFGERGQVTNLATAKGDTPLGEYIPLIRRYDIRLRARKYVEMLPYTHKSYSLFYVRHKYIPLQKNRLCSTSARTKNTRHVYCKYSHFGCDMGLIYHDCDPQKIDPVECGQSGEHLQIQPILSIIGRKKRHNGTLVLFDGWFCKMTKALVPSFHPSTRTLTRFLRDMLQRPSVRSSRRTPRPPRNPCPPSGRLLWSPEAPSCLLWMGNRREERGGRNNRFHRNYRVPFVKIGGTPYTRTRLSPSPLGSNIDLDEAWLAKSTSGVSRSSPSTKKDRERVTPTAQRKSAGPNLSSGKTFGFGPKAFWASQA